MTDAVIARPRPVITRALRRHHAALRRHHAALRRHHEERSDVVISRWPQALRAFAMTDDVVISRWPQALRAFAMTDDVVIARRA